MIRKYEEGQEVPYALAGFGNVTFNSDGWLKRGSEKGKGGDGGPAATEAAATMLPEHRRQCTLACTVATIEARIATRTAPADFEHHPFGLGGRGRSRARPYSVYAKDIPHDQNVPGRGGASRSDGRQLHCEMAHTLAEHDPDRKHRTYYPSAAALWDSVPITPPPQRCYRRVLREQTRPCPENSWLKCTHRECETVAAECDTDWAKRAPFSAEFAQAAKDLDDLKARGRALVATGADRARECGVTDGNWSALLWRTDGSFGGWGHQSHPPCVVPGCEQRRACVQIAQAFARAVYPETLSARDVAQAAAGHLPAAPSDPEDLLYENALARRYWPTADIPGAVATAEQIQRQYARERFVALRSLQGRDAEWWHSTPWSEIC